MIFSILRRLAFMIMLCWIFPVAFSIPSASGINQAQERLDNLKDTSRIDLLLKLSDELINSQPAEAFEYSREAFSLSNEVRDPYRIGLSCNSLADIYLVTAVYDKALEYYMKALSHFTDLFDSAQIAHCYNKIGMVHMSSGDFNEAQNYFGKALRLNKAINYPAQISTNYMNMGLNLLKTDSVDKGLSYFMVSLMIADSLNMEKEKVILMKNIGYGYARLGRHQDALGQFYKVLGLISDQPDDLTRSDAQVNIARGYYQLKNYPAALKYARQGYELAKSKRFDLIYRDASGLMSDIFAALGDYKSAYDYIKIYRDISDTILNADKAAQMARIRTIYDVNLKEEENLSLRNQLLQNLRSMRNRTLVMIVITFLVIILAALLYMLNRMNNRYVILNKKLSVQSEELQGLNDLKDKFFSFVAHNLKNPFNTIMGFSDLMQRAVDTKDLVKAKEYSGLIHNLSLQVQKVLSNLLEWSRLQRRTFEVKPETVELTSLIKDVVEMNNKEAARKDIALNISNDGNVFVVVDRTMITAVLQNLVTNAIQFTPHSGRISIDCRVNDEYTEVTITDTGIGIPEENMANLFDFDFSRTKIPDQGGSGLGLVICHEMLAKNGGKIYASSEPGKGSAFTFTLPVAIRHDTGKEPQSVHAESTPDDVTENLILWDTPANEDLLTDLRTIIAPSFEEVSKVLSIENLELFAKALIRTGEKYHHITLVDYGKSLRSLTVGHQIDQILRILPRFREYLRKNHIN